MALTLQYSLQDSFIKPDNVIGEYARLQVDSRPELNEITISSEDYQIVVNALAEGRLISIRNEAGVRLGQFITSLSGGVVVKDFISPSKEDVKISFKPTQHILGDIREIVSFEQLPTVRNDPAIAGFVFTDNSGNVSTDEIPISTNGLLHITGTNFIKDKMQVVVTQANEAASVKLNTIVKVGAKYIDVLVSNTDIDIANGFAVGKAILTAKRKDNEQRKYEYQFKII